MKYNSKINIAVGRLNLGDIRELKNMLAAIRVKAISVTNISETLDAPLILPRPRFPDGGTTPREIADTANSIGSITLCKHAGGAAVKYRAGKHKVPMITGTCHIGVANTDAFLENVSHLSGRQIPDELRKGGTAHRCETTDQSARSGSRVGLCDTCDRAPALYRGRRSPLMQTR